MPSPGNGGTADEPITKHEWLLRSYGTCYTVTSLEKAKWGRKSMGDRNRKIMEITGIAKIEVRQLFYLRQASYFLRQAGIAGIRSSYSI